jgi:hypothetical protein
MTAKTAANRRNVHFQNSRPKVVGESEVCIHLIRLLPSPRFSCFSQRCADLVKMLQDLFVGLEHAGLVVGDGMISTESFDNRLRFSQFVPG